jgi:hypothetical protein
MMSFKDDVFSNYSELMSLSIADDTPHKTAVDFVDLAASSGILDDKEKVEVMSNMMAQIVVGIESKAMDTALMMEKENLVITKEQALLDAQINEINAKISLLGAQTSTEEARQTDLGARA